MVCKFIACASGVLAFTLGIVARAADPEGARGLLADVDRIVAGEESEGWFGDDDAFRSIGPALLESTCRATPDARTEAPSTLQRRTASAGDPRALFAVSHEMSDPVAEALNVERQRHALELGVLGLQSDRQRFTLSLETAGNVQLRQTERHWDFGAGGFGRLLPGYGLNDRFTILAGVEFGGGAMVKPHTDASQFIINYFPAIPVVLRTHHRTWHYDLEVAPVALFQADNTRLSYGLRAGGGVGFSAIRRHNFLPWAGIAVSYEHYFAGGGRSPAEFIRSDLRVGFMWDP